MFGTDLDVILSFYNIPGLELNDEYDISQILTKASIVPGYGYTGKEIMEKLTTALGKVPGMDAWSVYVSTL